MELAYCVPLGLPHSEFLAWSADDQDKALAFLSDRSERCQDCGTKPAEWDPAQGGSRTAYVAEPIRCLGCETRAQAHRDLQHDADQNLGVHIILVPNEEDDDDPDGGAMVGA